MPCSAVLAHLCGYVYGLWTCYFSFLNAFSHVVMFFIFGFKYNPGLIASCVLNIPFGIYGISKLGPILTMSENVISIIVGILAQASMMIYGFGVLKKRVKNQEEGEELKENEVN